MHLAGARSRGALPEFHDYESPVAPTALRRPSNLTAGLDLGQFLRGEEQEELRRGTAHWFGTNSIPMSSEPERLELRINS
jgi:hypothetical protein